MKQKIQICDCTLRDGGYYTNWDFEESLVRDYFVAMDSIPAITHLEIGYRNKAKNTYYGEYFYCPEHVLKMARNLCPSKELAIMLNEKDVLPEDLDSLLTPCNNYIDLVRLAVAPINIDRAAILAKAIKDRNFKVGFNLMYMSNWAKDIDFIQSLGKLEGLVDYVYMVDSFGGIYPNDVKDALELVKKNLNIPVGFHGHNNLELGLANSLVAVESKCDVIDSTITGMGRGAGNLKTELLLTALSGKEEINFDFNKLNPIVSKFELMQNEYEWGTNLPYMISGAYSLPQAEVMSWISKKRYTTESIINALQNRKDNLKDNVTVNKFTSNTNNEYVIIIGGGQNTLKHKHAIKILCQKYPNTILIHAGTRYVKEFNSLKNKQYYCLLGAEGYKLEKTLDQLNLENIECIVEPSPRSMGTILPTQIIDRTYELSEINFGEQLPDSLLTIAFQLTIDLKAQNIFTIGLDGYDIKTDDQMIEVSKENQKIINLYQKNYKGIISLTPTSYSNLSIKSIYSYI